jgi:hypothetical protein
MRPKNRQGMFDGVFLLNHEICLIAKLEDRQGTFGSSMEYRADTSFKFEKESCDSLFTGYWQCLCDSRYPMEMSI